nr:uncharacterized protein LOC129267888 [Lytechinus pictus]
MNEVVCRCCKQTGHIEARCPTHDTPTVSSNQRPGNVQSSRWSLQPDTQRVLQRRYEGQDTDSVPYDTDFPHVARQPDKRPNQKRSNSQPRMTRSRSRALPTTSTNRRHHDNPDTDDRRFTFATGDNTDQRSRGTSTRAPNATQLNDALASGKFGEHGGELSVKSYGFRLIIPEGALEKDEQIDLRVLTEIPDGLRLQEDEMFVSHGFKLWPTGLHFKTRVKLIIPHCAVVTIPNKIETVLYSWNQSGTFERISHSANMICSVKDEWLEVLISHFCGGRFAIIWDWLNSPFRGILLSCMSFLPRTLPSSRRPVLEVRFAKKIRGQTWAIHYEDIQSHLKKTIYFVLDLNNNHDETLVTLYLDQDKDSDRKETIKFNTHFQDGKVQYEYAKSL